MAAAENAHSRLFGYLQTTIVKRINGEDISTISPTLGFSIKVPARCLSRGRHCPVFPTLPVPRTARTGHKPGLDAPQTMQYKAYRLNIWDVGGQKTLRSYWRNYYEQTDGLVWVVDSSDTRRLADCAAELAKLLQVTLQDSRAYPVHQASCALILGQGLRRVRGSSNALRVHHAGSTVTFAPAGGEAGRGDPAGVCEQAGPAWVADVRGDS